MMVKCGHLPTNGTISHFLWAFHFIKVYPKQDEWSATIRGSGGAINPNTWRKYMWPMAYTISLFEQQVVRERAVLLFLLSFLFDAKTSFSASLLLLDTF